jgi:hypothetical protein
LRNDINFLSEKGNARHLGRAAHAAAAAKAEAEQRLRLSLFPSTGWRAALKGGASLA